MSRLVSRPKMVGHQAGGPGIWTGTWALSGLSVGFNVCQGLSTNRKRSFLLIFKLPEDAFLKVNLAHNSMCLSVEILLKIFHHSFILPKFWVKWDNVECTYVAHIMTSVVFPGFFCESYKILQAKFYKPWSYEKRHTMYLVKGFALNLSKQTGINNNKQDFARWKQNILQVIGFKNYVDGCDLTF